MKNVLFILLFIISGCGYTTSGCRYVGEKIIIKPVTNSIDITSESRKYSTYESYPILIENRLTNKLVRKFNIDGSLKVVNYSPQALELVCNITDYKKEALRYSDDDDVREQRLRLYVKMKFTNPAGEILEERNVMGETTYFLTGITLTDGTSIRPKSETAAQADLIDDTARRISEAVLEEW